MTDRRDHFAAGAGDHPSRDVHDKPLEYENISGTDKIKFNSTRGSYGPEDLGPHIQQFWNDEGAATDPEVRHEARHHFDPAQGRLFDADAHEAEVRQQLGNDRFRPTSNAAQHLRNEALMTSTIPTSHLQPRAEGTKETTFSTESGNLREGWAGTGAAGMYYGPTGHMKPDAIAVDPDRPASRAATFVHEAGHRRHLGEMPAYNDYTDHPHQKNPDPLKEGVADAYMDRYGGPEANSVKQMKEDIDATGGESKFTSYGFTGYSTDPKRAEARDWNDTERALYAATRAHGSETGEQALYTPQGRDARERQSRAGNSEPTVDATLHHLMTTSPHAQRAVEELGLTDVANEAVRRHQDRQLLNQGQAVQESLFHELRGVDSGEVRGYTPNIEAMTTGTFHEKVESFSADIDRQEETAGESLWPEHMNYNQFGEKPRTAGDIEKTLGVERHHAEKQGFA